VKLVPLFLLVGVGGVCKEEDVIVWAFGKAGLAWCLAFFVP